MPRYRLYCFDGTWADRNAKHKNTLLAAIIDYIDRREDIEIQYYSGVGARNRLIEKYIGGICPPLPAPLHAPFANLMGRWSRY